MTPGRKEHSELVAILNRFYEKVAGRPPLEAEAIDPEDMPEPFHRLLVHQSDMTSTLIHYHRQDIRLWILERSVTSDFLLRHLVLESEATRKPVEYGAIRIHLNTLDSIARAQVIEGRRPLGGILNSRGVQYESRPLAFLRVVSNQLMNRAFGLKEPRLLYGRCNRLVDRSGRTIAEVVEVLPPEADSESNQP